MYQRYIMNRKLICILLGLVLNPILLFSQTDRNLEPITSYLNGKIYTGDNAKYSQADLFLPQAVENALKLYGVSGYTLLRNEIYARHGYIFKNNELKTIYSSAKWYKPDSSVGINIISGTESINVEFIKKIEDEYDYDVIAKFISDFRYNNGSFYSSDDQLAVPLNVQLSMNHLYLNPSRVFRNIIFANYGYRFTTPALKKVFSKVKWYSDKGLSESKAISYFTYADYVNLELLRNREWIEILESVKYTMPDSITVIPAVGMNALFIKEIRKYGEKFYFSNSSAWISLEETGNSIDEHITNTDELVTPQVVAKIQAEKNPRKKISLFFSNKKFKGYTDSVAFNHSDMIIPSYLESAVKSLNIDWRLLLRKEIHARHSAVFIDPNAGPIFKACSWYRPLYNLTTNTRSRFPENVKFTETELSNYSMLEGEELFSRYQAFKKQNIRAAIDLQGNVFFIKIEPIQLSSQNTITVGYGFSSAEEAARTSVLDIIKKRMKSIEENLQKLYEEELRQEERYSAGGC